MKQLKAVSWPKREYVYERQQIDMVKLQNEENESKFYKWLQEELKKVRYETFSYFIKQYGINTIINSGISPKQILDYIKFDENIVINEYLYKNSIL